MRVAIYPGSFDPITSGHINIIERSSEIFDEVIVAVLVNSEKNSLFTIEERVDLIKRVVKKYNNVKVESFQGLLANYMKDNNYNIIIKGLRAISDFEYEIQMAQINSKLADKVETLFMMTDEKYSYVSSSNVKQIAKFGGCLKDFVPEELIQDIEKKVRGE
ncbi:pantetheine-phosphate adenylyltransferase [Alloiococcus sp. CFN-8]|uniref:pantetheine-phosphate adenylyltransferase n=1 Tax=Alloiococcus sp. CFN-8 TaxID=3416081 RepID=UPI003CF07B4D